MDYPKIVKAPLKDFSVKPNLLDYQKIRKEFSWDKGLLCMFCFLTSVIGLNFFIALAVAGVMNTFFENKTIPYRK